MFTVNTMKCLVQSPDEEQINSAHTWLRQATWDTEAMTFTIKKLSNEAALRFCSPHK